jgi:hypothetical protein
MNSYSYFPEEGYDVDNGLPCVEHVTLNFIVIIKEVFDKSVRSMSLEILWRWLGI